METVSVSLSFSNYSDVNLNSKSQEIIKGMTNNSYFPNPKPTISELTNVTNEFENARIDALSKDVTKISKRNQLRSVLTQNLQQLGKYVEMEGHNDKTILLSSGYTVLERSKGIQELGIIENFKVELGANKGQIMSMCNGVNNKRSYMHQICDHLPIKEAEWMSYGSTSRKYLFSNLISGHRYYFRVIAIGSNNQQAVSNVLDFISQ